MNARVRQYLFGVVFIAVGIYQYVIHEPYETSLYAVAGLAFIVNALTLEPKLQRNRKPLVILSWLLIGASGIIFLYVLQYKYF